MRFREFAQLLFELNVSTQRRAIARFKAENPQLTDNEIKLMLDKWETYIDTMDPATRRQVSDINTVSWQQLATAVDNAEALANLKRTRGQPDAADLEPIYDNNNLVIYRGDSKPRCIHYGKGYTWCISRANAANLYNVFRYGRDEPIFYFVFDRDRDRTDDWHAVVIHVSKDHRYTVTTSSNQQDQSITWNELVRYHPKLANLKHVFRPQPLTDQEWEDYNQFSQPMSREQWGNLTVRQKIKAIEFGMPLFAEQQASLPYALLKLYLVHSTYQLSRDSWLRLKSGDFSYGIRLLRQQMKHDELEESEQVQTYWPDYFDPIFSQLHRQAILHQFVTGPDGSAQSAISYLRILAWHHYRNGQSDRQQLRRWPEAEHVIAASAPDATTYVEQVLKGRWTGPDRDTAEREIASETLLAIKYARVLDDRWPEPHRNTAEESIAENGYTAVEYAELLGGRWPKPHRDTAEKKMAEDSRIALKYAELLGGRWPKPHRDKAERNIAQETGVAVAYSQMLGDRWPEPYRNIAEKNISQDAWYAAKYAEVLGSRWPEPYRDTAEANMAQGMASAFDYAQVLGGRWPEPHRDTAERKIIWDSHYAAEYSKMIGMTGAEFSASLEKTANKQ